MQTARSFTSGEYLFDLFMALFSQELEPPQNPGRFSPLPWPGEECQSPVCGVRAGKYRPGETETIANITGVMRLWQAGRPDNG